MQDHAVGVLQPELAGAPIAEREANAGACIGAWELRHIGQSVDLPFHLDGGGADTADAVGLIWLPAFAGRTRRDGG